jgi:hypothetical protein
MVQIERRGTVVFATVIIYAPPESKYHLKTLSWAELEQQDGAKDALGYLPKETLEGARAT